MASRTAKKTKRPPANAALNPSVLTMPQDSMSVSMHVLPIPNASPASPAAVLSTPKAVNPKPLMCDLQLPVLPCHTKFRPDMMLPDINTNLRPHFPKSKGLVKQDVINGIDEYFRVIMQDLSSQGKYVPCQRVREILQDQLRSVNKGDGQRISDRDIPSWEKFYKCHGRIEELIKLFCYLSPFTSIHELEQAIISSEEVQNFEELCLGPILKHPFVQQYFKPPPDLKKAPEIRYYDIMSSLRMCMQQNRKGNMLQLDAFLEFMQKRFSVPSKEHLCIRISSFPLAIQTNSRFMRAERAVMQQIEKELERQCKIMLEHKADQLKQQIHKDFSLLPAARKTFPELIECMYNICSTHMKKHSSHFVKFLHAVLQDGSLQHAFMCVIYVAAYDVDITAPLQCSTISATNTPVYQTSYQPEGKVLKQVMESLSALQYPIDLASLSRVEEKISEDFSALDFASLGNGTFLRFLAMHEATIQVLGGSTIGSQYRPDNHTRQRILRMISQMKDKTNIMIISTCILNHFGATAEALGCGNVEKLVADESQASRLEEPNVIYLTPFLIQDCTEDTEVQVGKCAVGRLGHQSCDDALHCLSTAPLLEDLKEWTHWDLIYAAIHGDLSDFIQKQASSKKIYAIETSPGKLFRVDMTCTRQDFNLAVEAEDYVNTAGYLVSYILKCGGVSAASSELLSDQIRTILERMAINQLKGEVAASVFVLQCLLRIPLNLCDRIALKIFLDPLRRVFNQKAIDGLMSHCKSHKERIFLQSLGLLIGIKSWMDDFKSMIEDSSHTVHGHNKGATKAEETEGIKIVNNSPAVPSAYELDNIEILIPRVMQQTQTQDTVTDSPQSSSREEREAYCQDVIESIRRDEFGVGIELDHKEQMIADKQRSREGRSLARLSKELYSTDTHFVLELIQNADDNEYSRDLLQPESNDVPSLKFIVSSTSITVLNNEVGFLERHIRAICDVGKSTKETNRSGYIGQKGIGFKSVFRISDTPHVHSNGFHFMFDTRSGPVGYILPHWFPEMDKSSEQNQGWATKIVLPLKDTNNSGVMLRKFKDIQPSLLLFLNRLRKITVENEVTGEARVMKRVDKGDGVIIIEHDQMKDQWLVQRKMLQNTTKYKPEVISTEIALAFPLPTELGSANILAKDLMPQQVFAFLPLRTFGFRFVVQGDFDLPSAREDVNSDSPWNQWLREQIPLLFKDALLSCSKGLFGMSPVQATAFLLQFIPLEGELHDFFRPVSTSIQNCVRGIPCLPSDPILMNENSAPDALRLIVSCEEQSFNPLQGVIQWLQPSQLLLVRDVFIRDHILQDLVSASLHLHYMNSGLISAVNQSLQHQLRINDIGVDHLISVAQDVIAAYLSHSSNQSLQTDSPEDDCDKAASGNVDEIVIRWIANWFACVEIIMYSNHDLNTTTLSKLKKLTIIPLSNGSIVSAENDSIFFPPSQDETGFEGFPAIYKELMVVNAAVFKESDDASRTKAILKKIGVNELCISDVIRHHILPQFCSNNCKTKSKAVLHQYLTYIKKNIKQLEKSEADVVMSQLKSSVVVVTVSHGLRQPSKDPVHFSSGFHSKYDFKKLFPGVEWVLLDPLYIKNEKSDGVDAWRKFLEQIGVHTGIAVQQVEIHIAEQGSDRWNDLREVRRSPDAAYTIRDFCSPEVEQLIELVTKSSAEHQQMVNLLQMLDSMWAEYAKCMYADVYDGANKNNLGYRVPSSFCQTLTSCQWLPAKPSKNPSYCFENRYYVSHELYEDLPRIRRLLADHVPYIAVDLKSDLVKVLKLKGDVQFNEIVRFLKEWKSMSQSKRSFHASIHQMAEVYIYLRNQHNQESQDTLDFIAEDEYIFVPQELTNHSPSDLMVGKFYSVHKVCWRDCTTVLNDLLCNNYDLPSDIPRPLSLYYIPVNQTKFSDDIKSVFSLFGVSVEPNLAQRISILSFVSSLSPVPGKKELQHFVSIMEVILRECKQNLIQQQFVQASIADKKVLPVQDGWVSLRDQPIENDDENLYKIFKDIKGAYFLQWPAEPAHDKEIKAIRHDVTELLKIPFVSHCIKTSVVPELIEFNTDLQTKLNVCVQVVQSYLITKLPTHYKMMQDFPKTASKLRCYSATKLDVTHTLNVRNETLYAPPAATKCELDESECILYVLKTASNDKSVLVEPLCKLFLKSGTFDERREFKSFIQDLLLRDPSTDEQKQEILNSYSLCPVPTEEAWSVSYTAQLKQLPMVVDDVIEWTDPHADAEEDNDSERAEIPMRCWPPNAGNILNANSHSKGAHSKTSGANYAPSPEDVVSAEDVQRARNKYLKDDSSNAEFCNEDRNSQGLDDQYHTPSASYTQSHFTKHPSNPSDQSTDPAMVSTINDRSDDGNPQTSHVHVSSSKTFQPNFESPKQMHNPLLCKDVAIVLKPLQISAAIENILIQLAVPAGDLTTDKSVGEWGEKFVFLYLNQSKQLPDGRRIKQLTWNNEIGESFKPYDLIVEDDSGTVIYIEVKSTSGSLNQAAISWNELKFAREHSTDYHVYRVYEAGKVSCKVSYVEGLSLYLDNNPTTLYLII